MSLAVFLDVGILALDDDIHRRLTAQHVADHGLLALQALIDPEEVLDLAGDVVGQLGNVLIGVVGRVLEGNGDDLLVERAAVLHRDDADEVALNEAQRTDALRAEHQHIQRVAVVRPGAGDEAVVGGIVRGGVEYAVEDQQTGLLVQRQYKFIQSLEAALVRIENKTYGICRETGKLIPKERLRAVPHATLSVASKNARKQ